MTTATTQKLQVGSPAPEFKAQALLNGEFKDVSLADLKGKWVVLAFYPLDFTFVCPTELVSLKTSHDQFKEANAVVIAASTDSVFSHKAWCASDAKLGTLPYPVIGDTNHNVSRSYGVLIEDKGIALRGTFIIDDKGVLRHQSVNDLPVGRNVEEILRTLKALQSGGFTACDWKPGQPNLK